MNCINCQFELPSEAKFCLDCGAQQPFYCECGQQLPHSAKFCMECGCQVKEPVAEISTAPVAEIPEIPTAPVAEIPEITTAPVAEMPEISTAPVAEIPEIPTAPVAEMPEIPAAPVAEMPEISPAPVAEIPEIPPEPVTEIPEISTAPVAEMPEIPAAPVTEIPETPPEPVAEMPEVPTAPVAEMPEIPPTAVEETMPSYPEAEEETTCHSQALRLDFCGSGLRGNSGLYLRSLQGKLYYYQREQQGVCQANEDGSEEKVIISCPATPSGLVVNETGIYLHYLGHLQLGVQQYSLDGQYKASMDVPLHAQMCEVLVESDTAYVSVTELVDIEQWKEYVNRRGEITALPREKRKDLIYYLNFSDQSQKAFNFYGEHGEFNLICADDDEIIFRANFSEDLTGILLKNSGLYRYNKEHNTIASLTHRACQPHWIASDKDRYLKSSESNRDAIVGLSIPFFDLDKNLMWVQQEDEKGKYLEARTIESPSKSQVFTNIEKWYYDFDDSSFSWVYFNGSLMYRLKDDDSLVSVLSDGSEVILTAEEHCQKFVVLEDSVYIYSQNYDLHQHQAKSHGLPLVRNLALHFP